MSCTWCSLLELFTAESFLFGSLTANCCYSSPLLTQMSLRWCHESLQFPFKPDMILNQQKPKDSSFICSFFLRSHPSVLGFWPEVTADGKYWRDNGCSLALLPNHFQFAVRASSCWTAEFPPGVFLLQSYKQTRLNRNPTSRASWFLFDLIHMASFSKTFWSPLWCKNKTAASGAFGRE